MTDNITLPREVVEKAIKAFENGCPPTCENGMIDSGGFHPWGEPMLDLCPACLAFEHLRTHLAAEQPKPEPVALAKDWLKMTLRVNRGDRVFLIERFLHLSEIKQSHFPLVPETADSAWQELNAAMKRGDKT